MQRQRVARKLIELEQSDPIDPGAKGHILTLLTKKDRNFKLSETPPHSKFPKTTPNQKKNQISIRWSQTFFDSDAHHNSSCWGFNAQSIDAESKPLEIRPLQQKPKNFEKPKMKPETSLPQGQLLIWPKVPLVTHQSVVSPCIIRHSHIIGIVSYSMTLLRPR